LRSEFARYLLDIQDSAANTLAGRIEAAGLPAPVYSHCDLTDTAALESVMSPVLEKFTAVDVLVNNAGNDTRHKMKKSPRLLGTGL